MGKMMKEEKDASLLKVETQGALRTDLFAFELISDSKSLPRLKGAETVPPGCEEAPLSCLA